MRTFERVGPVRVESKDGIAIFSIDRFRIRYQRPDKYCDLYVEPFYEHDQIAGFAVAISRGQKYGRFDILWHCSDGTNATATDSEVSEITTDIIAAWSVFGWKVKFD